MPADLLIMTTNFTLFHRSAHEIAFIAAVSARSFDYQRQVFMIVPGFLISMPMIFRFPPADLRIERTISICGHELTLLDDFSGNDHGIAAMNSNLTAMITVMTTKSV
jgi:hypothetical protein